VTIIYMLGVLALPYLYTKSAGSLQESLSKTPWNLDIIDLYGWKKLHFLTLYVCKNLMKPAIYP
jgi:hypothetical protein